MRLWASHLKIYFNIFFIFRWSTIWRILHSGQWRPVFVNSNKK
jgi:hypothetical protein